ncbi:AAA family ATPase, partial [Thomasclavelia sp.]|uniref:AAA family ATPase n=1 Tax=Thomasclavelia sp. TaxID=3025757 RepID=UPI0025DEDB4E
KKKRLAKELSKGMNQKLSLILALMIQPKALLVDEPMVGLDPASIEMVLQIFKQLKEAGCAILISTHIIDIIDDIYDEAYIMNKGKIVERVERNSLDNESLKEYFFEATDGE